MKTYHKIQTIFQRDLTQKHKPIIEGLYTLPEFEYLENNEWVATEKIDGTNIRIIWDGKEVLFMGKTDNAQIPAHLVNHLKSVFTEEKMEKVFPLEEEETVCLYGEGYGKKIQKGGNYLSDSVDFILFDVKIGRWWLRRSDVESISNDLNIPIVPIIRKFTLKEAVDIVKKGFISTISENRSYIAEGLILKPEVDLFSRNGQRIITKVKHVDFKKLTIKE